MMLDQGWPLNLDRTGPAWSWFDATRYGLCDGLAARAARQGPEAALEDYLERGAALNHAPNLYFDPLFYLAAYRDVAGQVAARDVRSAFDHYRLIGWRERDPHWLFSIDRYAANYHDLSPDKVEAVGGLYGHYLVNGAREHRAAHRFFDAKWYMARLPAAVAAAAAADPFGHFLAAYGQAAGTAREPRGSPYFDPAWYLATYPDVAKAEAGRPPGALRHYMTVGAGEGRDPSCDFSETDYRALNPDVQAAIEKGYFRNAFQHFLDFGAAGLRSPSAEVDLGWYAGQPPVARDLVRGVAPDAFVHMLEVGIPQGLPLRPPLAAGFAPAEAEARGLFLSQARRALPAFGRHRLEFGYTGEPALSVIVVLRNQFALTMQALASLRQNFAGAIQLLVVDNASGDETRSIGELVRGAVLIRLEENTGFVRACNLALQQAVAPAILYLNNDVVLHPGAVEVALARLAADAGVGAVGGKIVRTHGLLQEAGCLLWRDGSAEGWMRDAPADAPEANYVRDVDFCSGAFLLVRGDLLRDLGGFDDAFAPAYCEEVDLCLRIQAAGLRVVYDPAVVLTHYEYASSRSARAAVALMAANRTVLQARHPAALRARVGDRRRRPEAAAWATAGRRLLFIEDTVPLHRLGSGLPRAADTLIALVEAGWQATVLPMQPVRTPAFQITADLPETAEILWDRDHRSLGALLDERQGYYDLIWVSRAHNLRLLLDVLSRSGAGVEGARLVLDTEAVFSLRDQAKAALDGLPFALGPALEREFEGAWQCDHVVAVSEAEATVLRGAGLQSVGVVGQPAWHTGAPSPPRTERPWGERRGLLHVGALNALDSPNCEGLRWYLHEVQPLLRGLVGAEDATLSVVGPVSPDIDLSWLREHPAVRFVGPVGDVGPLYARHRAAVAPTRFAAGLPTKVLDAAAGGLPTACTTLLAGQLGWAHGGEVLAAEGGDAAAFAANVARLLTDAAAWSKTRAAAIAAVEGPYSPASFSRQLAAAVAASGARAPARPS